MTVTSEELDIVGSYDNQKISEISAARSINVFEYIDPVGKKPKVLLPTSGLINQNLPLTSSSGGFRCDYVFKNIRYAVVGNIFYRINNANQTSILGFLTSYSGYVGIDANTNQIIIVDGVRGYIFDIDTNIFVPITDPAFPFNPIDVCYLDGFFVVADGGTNNFQLSSFNQGLIWGVDNNGTDNTFTLAAASSHFVLGTGNTSYYQIGTPVTFSGNSLPVEIKAGVIYYIASVIDATTFEVSATDGGTIITSSLGGSGSVTNSGQLQLGSITAHPGNIVACRTLHRRLFLFSSFFTEVWENQGIGTTLPFRRNNALLIEYGTPSVWSIATSFDRMFFLSQDRGGVGSIMEVQSVQAMPVSGKALDFQIAQYAANQGISDACGFLIKERGMIFYRLNFTKSNHTFVLNVSMSTQQDPKWHEEETLVGNRHPAQTHVFFNGKNYYGHFSSPISYIVDSQTYTNDGELIKRTRITKPFLTPVYKRRRVDRLQVDFLQGSADLLSEITSKMLVYLTVSKDGGVSYGNSISAPMGGIGERTFRTVWRKLGVIPRGQAFVGKFEFYEPAPFVILGAAWYFEMMPE